MKNIFLLLGEPCTGKSVLASHLKGTRLSGYYLNDCIKIIKTDAKQDYTPLYIIDDIPYNKLRNCIEALFDVSTPVFLICTPPVGADLSWLQGASYESRIFLYRPVPPTTFFLTELKTEVA